MSMLATTSGVDVMELCGGQGLPGKLAVRRRLTQGGNFDLVTDVDLNTQRGQRLGLKRGKDVVRANSPSKSRPKRRLPLQLPRPVAATTKPSLVIITGRLYQP